MINKKTYYNLLSEISSEELFDGLLGHGLFADKIPPFLSSESFLDFCKNPPNGFNFEVKPARYVKYENMRNINIPRILSIPNPIAYYNLCNVLSNNWMELLTYFYEKTKNNTHKVSRIHIRKIEDSLNILDSCYDNLDEIDLDDYSNNIQSHLFEMNHKNFCVDDYPEPSLQIASKYIVKADISNCFPSMYSHSLCWALVGKTISKSNRDKNEWFNKIDKYTRNLKDAETHGFLIGPHASNLLSEIILIAVDEELHAKGYKYIRNVDDYTVYLESRDRADEFLVILASELRKYNLTLNHKKTEILASAEHWVRKLSGHVFVMTDEDKLGLKTTRAYLDIAIELMQENKENSAILNYTIKVLSKKEMTSFSKDYFLKTVHHLVLLYPYLVTLLDENIFERFNISTDEIEIISKSIFELGTKEDLFESMSYALYFSIKYNFILDTDLFDKVKESNDSILLLLSYLHDEKFINDSEVTTKYKVLARLLKEDIDEYWIFIYEVLGSNDLARYWSNMKKENITFIKEEFGVKNV